MIGKRYIIYSPRRHGKYLRRLQLRLLNKLIECHTGDEPAFIPADIFDKPVRQEKHKNNRDLPGLW